MFMAKGESQYSRGASVTDQEKRTFRSRLGRSIQSAGYASGAMHVASRITGRCGAVVLMYHSVADENSLPFIDPRNHISPGNFERQMAFLARHRTVRSLTDVLSDVRSGRPITRGTVVITFDDGYLDNLTVAAPILKKYEMPATLFLPTAYIDRAEAQWIDQVFTAFTFRKVNELTLGHGGRTTIFDLQQANDRQSAYGILCRSLLSADPGARRDVLEDVREQLQPSQSPPRLTMSWSDVQSLIRNCPGLEIGGHTVEHTDMTAVSEDWAQSEIERCRSRIEETLGRAPEHFSFPYGRATSSLRAQVREAGFTSACGGGGEPLVTSTTDPWALSRIEAPPTMDRFDMLTSGAYAGLWRRIGR